MTDGRRKVDLRELLALFSWLTERRVRSMVHEKAVDYWKIRGRLYFDPAEFQRMEDQGYVPGHQHRA